MIAYDYTNRRFSRQVGILIRYIKPTHRYEWHIRWKGPERYKKTVVDKQTGFVEITIQREYLEDSYEYFMLAVEEVFTTIANRSIYHIINKTTDDNPDIIKIKTV